MPFCLMPTFRVSRMVWAPKARRLSQPQNSPPHNSKPSEGARNQRRADLLLIRLAQSNSPLPMLKRLPPEASANALDAFAGFILLVIVLIYIWQYSWWHNLSWYIEYVLPINVLLLWTPPSPENLLALFSWLVESKFFTITTALNSVSFQDRLHYMIHR